MKTTMKLCVAHALGMVMAANAAMAQAGPEATPAPQAASPAVSSNEAFDDIVVTARKRSESLQEVPLSITAVNSALIERNNISKIDQVAALTPSVILQPSSGAPGSIAAYIRGIGNRASEPSQDAPIAISVDGVYLAEIAGSLVDVFDVQQIEVLCGPQGTLQGRNSPGGAINVTTRRPTGEAGARMQVNYARFNELQLKAAIEAPIVDGVLSGKISAFSNTGGNYVKNVTTGDHVGGVRDWGGRLGLLFTPSAAFTAYLTADYVRDTSPPSPIRSVGHSGSRGPLEPEPLVCTLFGFCTPANKYETQSAFVKRNSSKNGGFGLNADWNLGPVTLTSITGYRYVNEDVNVDNGYVNAIVINVAPRNIKAHAVSQELRLASNGNSPFSYVVGLYGIRSKFDLDMFLQLGGPLVGLPDAITTEQKRSQVTKSYAIFGQASYKLTDAWSISGGARQTFDRKRMITQPSVPGPIGEFNAKFDNLSIELGTEYRFSRGNMAYFRFSQGYRAGGINGAADSLPHVNIYKPETVDSLEVGLKTEWPDQHLTANFTAFSYRYKDQQLTAIIPTNNGYVAQIVNALGLKISGVEFEGNWRPTDELTFQASVGYLHTKYRSVVLDLGLGPVNMADLPKDYSPKFTGYFGADYKIPLQGSAGSVTLSSDVDYRSAAFNSPIPSPSSLQKKYALVNGSITYKTDNDKYSIAIYGRNLTNKFYQYSSEPASGIFLFEAMGRPRTFGVKATAEF